MAMDPIRSLHVSLARQEVTLLRPGQEPLVFPVSTSRNGPGNVNDSECTPTGNLRVAEKIGAGEPLGTIFVSRQPQGIWQPGDTVEGDLVLSRILWLEGMDPENANAKGRFIYLHGTNQEELVGQPVSHGCIRLRNGDMMALFDLVETGDLVVIG